MKLKKNSNWWYKFLLLKCVVFLPFMHVLSLLELKQILKNFLNLKICKVHLIGHRETLKKHQREIEREWEKNHRCRYKFVYCTCSVIFCWWRKKVYGKIALFCYQHQSKPKFRWQSFFPFLRNEQKL